MIIEASDHKATKLYEGFHYYIGYKLDTIFILFIYFSYNPPPLAISALYWKAWLMLLVLAATNPATLGMYLC